MSSEKRRTLPVGIWIISSNSLQRPVNQGYRLLLEPMPEAPVSIMAPPWPMRSGYSLEQAVRCGTLNGARLLGIADMGLLAPRMPATFIAVKGDPDGFPDSLKEIEGVYIKGELCQPPFKP